MKLLAKIRSFKFLTTGNCSSYPLEDMVNIFENHLCFMQCNEPRTDDAPPADINMSNQSSLGKKGQEAG